MANHDNENAQAYSLNAEIDEALAWCSYSNGHKTARLLVRLRDQLTAQAKVLDLVRRVESDMSEQAADAWRSADARRGLTDHDALLVHADALTRWSERFRMAYDGDYYRAPADELT